MIKVLIVDDEVLVRIGIISCIPWDVNGFEIIGQAEDGVQALEMVYKHKPDLVLTDIKMPNMNGLELIEIITKSFENTKIIVLSCLSEIDYVKKAMKMGADDYILKLSMKPEALLQVLLKLKEEILAERENNANSPSLKSIEIFNKLAIKRDIFKKFLSGSIEPDQFACELKAINIRLEFENIMVIFCSIDDYKKFILNRSIESQEIARYALINLAEENMIEFAKGEIAEIENGEYLILLQIESSSNAFYKKINNFLINLNQSFEKYLNLTASFCISEISSDPQYIFNSYKESKKAIEFRFYSGKRSMILLSEANIFDNREVFLDEEQEKKIFLLAQNKDFEGIRTIIDGFLDKISSNKNTLPIKVKTVIVNIIYNLVKILRKEEAQYGIVNVLKDSKFSELIINADTIDEIRVQVKAFIDVLDKQTVINGLHKNRPEILRIKRYIIENMDKNISLEEAARIVNISRSYFSQIFKKETGEKYSDYVNRIKIQKAKDLIMENDLKVFEAAQMVGFGDEFYFNKLFKKYIGYPPGKVRKR